MYCYDGKYCSYNGHIIILNFICIAFNFLQNALQMHAITEQDKIVHTVRIKRIKTKGKQNIRSDKTKCIGIGE